MTKFKRQGFVFALMVFVSATGHAADKPEHPMPMKMPEFGKLAGLTGTWEAVQVKDGKKQLMKVNYKLTAGRTALVETLFPGTPQEMVSIYHQGDGVLEMTHYCMLGNQPNFRLKKSDESDVMEFEFSDTPGLDEGDPHMHSLKITFLDKNHIRQEWAFYSEGKQQMLETFDLKRKK